MDVNDNPPRFSSSAYVVEVSEATPLGSTVLVVTAEDRDDGHNGQVTFKSEQQAVSTPRRLTRRLTVHLRLTELETKEY